MKKLNLWLLTTLATPPKITTQNVNDLKSSLMPLVGAQPHDSMDNQITEDTLN